MKNDFIKCGGLGRCMEIFCTGLHALGNREWKMTGHLSSSHVSHLRHGSVSALSRRLKKSSHPDSRQSLHAGNFCLCELGTGMFLKHFHMCPWDYSNTPYHYKGVIRLDYAPVWFFTGLFYEKILSLKE